MTRPGTVAVMMEGHAKLYEKFFDALVEIVNEEQPYALKWQVLKLAAKDCGVMAENALEELASWAAEDPKL